MAYTWHPLALKFFEVAQPVVDHLEKLAWIGQSTHVVKLPALDSALEPTAASLGMDLMIFKYLLGLFLVYPFGGVLYALPGRNAKHLFSFIFGFLLVQWIFGPDWIHTFVSSFVTYLLCAILPGKYSAKVAFVWVMGYMTMSHAYRMYVSYLTGQFDFTGTQMVLTMKLTSFAYNLYDGTYDAKHVMVDSHDSREQKIRLQKRKFVITKLPNLLEFFGYIYCFTCILCGPAFEFSDYVASIEGTAFELNGKKKHPNTFLPSFKTLLFGLLCMVGHLKLSATYKLSTLYNVEFIASHTFLERWIHMMLAMFAERLKYYFAWKLAEAASIFGGFGFEGYDKEGKEIGWKGVENIDIIGFETTPNIQTATRTWNKRTQGWLERYSYLRLNKSLIAVYFISALWHGLYPGFFLMFLSVPILTECERLIRAKINPIIVPGYDGFKQETYPNTIIAKIYWVICVIVSVITMNYTAQVFSMGSFERSWRVLQSYHFCGNLAAIGLYIILTILPGPKKEKSSKDKKQE